METSVEKTKEKRISKEPYPLQIVTGQKQLENVKCFDYLDSMITNNARYSREIKSRISMAKGTFKRKKAIFTSKLDLNLRKKLVKCYIWSIANLWC
jgi:hypothetical protein